MGYAAPAKWFHWITVALMLVALPTGIVIEHIRDADKMRFYAIHESAGLTTFLVALARLAYRLRNPPPEASHQPRLFRLAATTVHHALYAALIVQPVLGFLATNAFGFPLRGQTAYLGFIHLPRFMETNVPLAEALLAAHLWLGWVIAALLVLHVSAVVFHQAIRRDGTLDRMI
ncbi:cytochrome b [Sabulicella rubraurantiaca]|uniref:cytochrome b n=1 Tax=Sabulicella rubraurantiaca TaxID=2811429 RepID=UPI001A967DE0|nr:cytochrome b/b6 domain-containing protein [Sabulicella rubraurantiaca]